MIAAYYVGGFISVLIIAVISALFLPRCFPLSSPASPGPKGE